MVLSCINIAECFLRSESVQASGGLSQDTSFSQAVLEGGVATAIGLVPPQHNWYRVWLSFCKNALSFLQQWELTLVNEMRA